MNECKKKDCNCDCMHPSKNLESNHAILITIALTCWLIISFKSFFWWGFKASKASQFFALDVRKTNWFPNFLLEQDSLGMSLDMDYYHFACWPFDKWQYNLFILLKAKPDIEKAYKSKISCSATYIAAVCLSLNYFAFGLLSYFWSWILMKHE